jgi:Tetratricopeptide repeat
MAAATAAGDWPPRMAQEARLRALDARLADPSAIETRVERAALLNALGRFEEARQAYLDVLARAPDHFGALNDFGVMLSASGFRSAARTLYLRAVARHPDNPKGHVNLANLLLREGKLAAACGNDEGAASSLAAARRHFEMALQLDPDLPQAHQGLGAVLAELSDPDGAAAHRQQGYGGHSITTLPYRGTRPALPLLVLASSTGGDIPTASFLDDRVFLSHVVVADFWNPEAELPTHQLILNTIGDADLCGSALAAAAALVQRSPAPVINPPAAVAATGRVANAERLGALPGVVAPTMLALPRRSLAGQGGTSLLAQYGFAFPLLLRSPGFHTGRNFVQVAAASELTTAAASLPGDSVLAISYLDARGADGNARKYRVMIVDGCIYPLHVAVSRHWKVHYFTADMAENPAHRGEDSAFLEDMPKEIGSKAMAALERIRDALGLDYGGIDFGLGPNGEVLLFEANATMVVNLPDSDPRWTYRRPAVERILDATRAMLIGRAY